MRRAGQGGERRRKEGNRERHVQMAGNGRLSEKGEKEGQIAGMPPACHELFALLLLPVLFQILLPVSVPWARGNQPPAMCKECCTQQHQCQSENKSTMSAGFLMVVHSPPVPVPTPCHAVPNEINSP